MVLNGALDLFHIDSLFGQGIDKNIICGLMIAHDNFILRLLMGLEGVRTIRVESIRSREITHHGPG
jgi:hypothetical protein